LKQAPEKPKNVSVVLGLKQAPKKPENVSVVLEGETAASVKWSPAPRAQHYRVWVKVMGVDDEAKPVGRAGDCDFTIENLPPNAEVEVSISAVNTGGESGRSDVVLVATMKETSGAVCGETLSTTSSAAEIDVV
ncbi:MAG: fibronectin type III domain-containing protein, partial [Limisphaerales bacterium]